MQIIIQHSIFGVWNCDSWDDYILSWCVLGTKKLSSHDFIFWTGWSVILSQHRNLLLNLKLRISNKVLTLELFFEKNLFLKHPILTKKSWVSSWCWTVGLIFNLSRTWLAMVDGASHPFFWLLGSGWEEVENLFYLTFKVGRSCKFCDAVERDMAYHLAFWPLTIPTHLQDSKMTHSFDKEFQWLWICARSIRTEKPTPRNWIF